MNAIGPAVNININPETLEILNLIASTRDTSLSSVANSLLEEAIDIQEEIYLSNLARIRHRDDPSKFVSHEDVWKKLLPD